MQLNTRHQLQPRHANPPTLHAGGEDKSLTRSWCQTFVIIAMCGVCRASGCASCGCSLVLGHVAVGRGRGAEGGGRQWESLSYKYRIVSSQSSSTCAFQSYLLHLIQVSIRTYALPDGTVINVFAGFWQDHNVSSCPVPKYMPTMFAPSSGPCQLTACWMYYALFNTNETVFNRAPMFIQDLSPQVFHTFSR